MSEIRISTHNAHAINDFIGNNYAAFSAHLEMYEALETSVDAELRAQEVTGELERQLGIK